MKAPLHVFLIACLGMMSCSDATSPEPQPQLVLQTSMNHDAAMLVVRRIDAKADGIQNEGIDSIRVDSIQVLFSRIKLHWSDDVDDDNDDADSVGSDDDADRQRGTVKTGPMVLTWRRGTISTAFSAPVPTGRFDKIKFEMHKASGSEEREWLQSPVLAPFVQPEPATVLLHGSVYQDGRKETFVVRSKRTKNLWMKFEPYVEITASTTTTIEMSFDAVRMFRVGGSLIDPRKNDGKLRLDDVFDDCFSLWKR